MEHNQLHIVIEAASMQAQLPKAVYFLGIGGIGMSALARYYASLGCKVSGYDKTATDLTRKLEAEGMEIHYEDNVALIDKDVDFVLYTPAIPKDHTELSYYKNEGYSVLKRSEALGKITDHSKSICVAGTHGKSTTSAMVAHLLRHSGFGCNAFLGAIAANYQTNFWSSSNPVCVVEADEYDRSFLNLAPEIAIVTSMDADHLDIYGTSSVMEDAFVDFTHKIKEGGCLISKLGLSREADFAKVENIRYHLNNNKADAYAVNIIIKEGGYNFDLHFGGEIIKDIYLPMGGLHNIENAIAAIIVAKKLDISDDKIREALEEFKGVKRRFEYIIKTEQLVYIDDYAHHPEELNALITGARNLFPDKKCCLIFQPHLFSRTIDFAKQFAEVLSKADETILLPIYAAREKPMEGITSEIILNKLTNKQHHLFSKEEMLEYISTQKNQLIITAGAGDIDTCIQPLKQILLNA